jgi:predicted RNA-binding Zn-ribbon protein involved in translation (DUF1610 family)
MAFMLACPSCGEEGLDPRRSETSCTACGDTFTLVAHCPQCDAVLERVQACGAVDFFCNSCNSLVSKRSARFAMTKVG